MMKYFMMFMVSGWFLISMSSCKTSSTSSTNLDTKFGAGQSIKRVLKAGETHRYSVELLPGEMLHIKAEQYGIDLIAKVSSSDGLFMELFDSPTGELGAENIYILSKEKTTYSIEIYTAQKYADSGTYELSLVKKEKAAEKDMDWFMALAAMQKADKLRAKADTRAQSISQYELALTDWLRLRDTFQYAQTLRSMAFVLSRLKQYDQSIEVFNRLIPLWNQLGDSRSAGFSLLVIGRIYEIQKEYQKALDYNLNSLPYSRKLNDTDQEAFTHMNIGDLYSYLGNAEQAVSNFEQALKMIEHSKRPSIKAVILRDYGNSLMRVGQDEKAVSMYQLSLQQWKNTVNTPEEARTAVLLADYFSKKNDRMNATHYYQQALTIWRTLKDEKEIKAIEESLNTLPK
ncbi:MAG: tetratricopeptide repeat protein [Saprospiraceae bacterium]